MKILLIHTHYQLQGGEDAVVEQELEFLKQHHDVEILRFQNLSIWKGALQFLVSIWNIGAAKKVKSKIREFQPDVVHVHNWHFAMGPLVFRVINRLGIPLVHTVHNYRLLCPSAILLNEGKLFTKSLKDPFPWSAVRNKVYRSSAVQTFWLAFVVWFHKKIGTWKKIDSYVCLTPFAVDLFQQSNFGVSKEQFTVKPNFTRIPEVSQPIKRGEHFLFIGRLSEEKGIDILLHAFKELPFSLQIAGDGPLKEQVVNATKESSNISYLGNLSNEKVIEELQKAQALIFPSVWYETFGLVNIEAFVSRTPVLASNIGAPQSLIRDGYNGFLFEPGKVNRLREVISKFNALSIIEKGKMGANAFESYQSNYTPELQEHYFESIYNQVLKK
ncbi:glycosyltransferase involved in cell wall biosynthesis [Flavobacterium sp. CG_23.5]|uniref:glycosyltransferase n=1 Tax=Flavobacterium sp. CG_23.5 TaxID=2760708 RepID=UPI001AE54026|nr:glycosyltransferase [Flavobacterium sp. CG_23.5]MBP2283119.1 glycosyltransferase involved in cell wall biosynthesis [Flavobacterium sp. CG_23.5]